ncbi:MAG: helix-turn-helix domain-containing protein [Pseudonocardiaceae bacterium]
MRTVPDVAQAGLDSLTPQEFQVAQSVAVGRNNVEVASSLFASRKTVEAHLTRIYRELGVRSRTELARRLASVSIPPVQAVVTSRPSGRRDDCRRGTGALTHQPASRSSA